MSKKTDKANVRLEHELNSMRKHINSLYHQKSPAHLIGLQKQKLEHFLQERVKELSCMYEISRLIEKNPQSLSKIMEGTANLLPPSWQYPEIACGRIVFEEKVFMSARFKPSDWKQSARIKSGRTNIGFVDVFYSSEMPTLHEGPFLKEERLLIDAVAERLGRVATRIHAEEKLQTERTALRNMNIALHEVLKRMEEEKKDIAAAVQANVDKIILPILHDLEIRMPAEHRDYLDLLKNNLEDITAPYMDKLSKSITSLSPSELRISNMIRTGLSTKDIARIQHISTATVSRHRENIRRKLGIANKDINLTSFLVTHLSTESS